MIVGEGFFSLPLFFGENMEYKLKTALVSVGVTAVPLTAATTDYLKFGIVLQADPANTGNVFIGDSDVTTATGIQLTAGQSISLTDFASTKGVHEWDLRKIFVVASAAAQAIRVAYSDCTRA
jgi:hypothetical protein